MGDPPTPPPSDVTAMLLDWSAGDAAALDRLIPLVYEQLRALARIHLRGERARHTLQPTALVHETFLRLVDQQNVTWQNRAHFFALAARAMRRILVDHARAHNSAKRGGLQPKVSLDGMELAPAQSDASFLELDGALDKLAALYPRPGQVVELKFFGGLEAHEIAESLQVSEKTVLRDWSFAKLWLCRELSGAAHSDADPIAS